MENDQVFAADAILDQSPNSSPSSYTGHRGHDVMQAAVGGIEPQKITDYEDSPLLSRDHDRDYGAGRLTSNENDGRPLPTWSGERDHEGKPWWNTPSVYWLLPPFLIYSLAFGGVIVPKLNLILSLICQQYFSDRAARDHTFHFMKVDIGSDNPQCRIPEVQALVTKFQLYINVIAGILSAITSPKLGALSDRYGRRKVMLLATLGMLVNESITIIAATYPDMVSVNWLLLGAVCDGLCGSFTASMAISYAYATDCTAPPKRVVTFAYFHGCLFTGIALGPIAAGFIIKATGQLLTIFYIAIGAHLFYLLCLMLIIPESLSKERQLIAREKKDYVGETGWTTSWNWAQTGKYLVTGGGLFTPLSILWPTGEGSSPAVRRNLVLLAAVDTTMFGVAMGSMSIVVYYSEFMFGWGTFESSIFVSIVNISRVTCLLAVLPIVVRLIRGRQGSVPQRNSGSDGLDLAIIRTAVAFDTLGYIGYATARTGNLYILAGAVAAIGGMGSPSLQSSLTKHVPPDRTGQLLGAVGLLHSLARVISPTIFNLIYAATVGKFTQTVFVCLAVGFGASFVMSWFIRPHVYYDEPGHLRPQSQSATADEEVIR